MCGEGYKALESVQTRDIECNGFNVRLQFNPKRLISTAANVDAKSIAERKCFLCLENLPPDQKGILYKNDFIILCNPMPIFSAHYTVSNVRHLPQQLDPFLESFLMLAKDFSPGFSIFYNGPKCGASAPDHMHFQAVPYGGIPIEIEATHPRRRSLLLAGHHASLYLLNRLGRTALLIEGIYIEDVAREVRVVIERIKEFQKTSEEPLLNVLCSFREDCWRVIVFPRAKHRPDVYFKDGDERLVISPATVDIGGLVVTPMEKDFKRVDAKMIEDIFQEVTLTL